MILILRIHTDRIDETKNTLITERQLLDHGLPNVCQPLSGCPVKQ